MAFRPVVSAWSSGVADVQAVDRDVFFTDDDLIAETVGNAGKGVARHRFRIPFLVSIASRETSAAEETALIRLFFLTKDAADPNVVVMVAVCCGRAAIQASVRVG